MFGLYAPFVQESHRLKAITLMTEQASGSVHLMFGLNASRVPNKISFITAQSAYNSNEKRMENISGTGLGLYLTFNMPET